MHDLQPDVAFLDVEMPRMNGRQLAEKINEASKHTKIISYTGVELGKVANGRDVAQQGDDILSAFFVLLLSLC